MRQNGGVVGRFLVWVGNVTFTRFHVVVQVAHGLRGLVLEHLSAVHAARVRHQFAFVR